MSDISVENNILAEMEDAMVEDDMPHELIGRAVFIYDMEESLAENMYNLSMEASINDDDVDITPTPSSRPPTEPFGMNDYSEDDPAEMPNVTTLAGIADMIEKHNTEYPDVRVLMKCIDPGFFKYGTILAELEKWSNSTDDFIQENSFNCFDAETSYTP